MEFYYISIFHTKNEIIGCKSFYSSIYIYDLSFLINILVIVMIGLGLGMHTWRTTDTTSGRCMLLAGVLIQPSLVKETTSWPPIVLTLNR